MYEPPFERTVSIDQLSMRIAELVGMLQPQSAFATSPRLHRELRIRTIHSSLAIEGNSLDQQAVTAIVDGKRVLGPETDIREVENAQRTYAMLADLDPLSVKDLLVAHEVMMSGLIPDAGRFRTGNVGVYREGHLIHAGTPAKHVGDVISDLFSWLAETGTHPLLASCIFHHEFEFIHPFSDGNGRIGRFWQTLLLARWRPMLQWLPVESMIIQRQDEYYQRFVQANKAGSSTVFVEFMLEIIAAALEPFAQPEDPAEMRGRIALDFFRSHPWGTVRELAEELGSSMATAERVVKNMRESGQLIRVGSTRSGVWEVRD